MALYVENSQQSGTPHHGGKSPKSPAPKRPAAVVIILNLLLMLVVAAVLGWLTMTWLSWWTHHGDTATVPSVKGMMYDNAVALIAEKGMVVELSDSVYESKARPGEVMEQNPRAGSTVKPGRTVYLTVNAFYPRKITVPVLNDVSLRQARSALEGLGVTDIREVSVVSEYKDLVLGAEYDGKPLRAGMRIPINARVTLKVGDGLYEVPDTLDVDDNYELDH